MLAWRVAWVSIRCWPILQRYKLQHIKMSSAADKLLGAAFRSASGIVTLDATGLQEEGNNSLSNYPPALKTKQDTSYYNEDPAQKDQLGLGVHSEQSVAVNVSLLQGAAFETPASLDHQHQHQHQHSTYPSNPDLQRRTSTTAGSYGSQKSRLDSPGVALGFMSGGTKDSGTAPRNYSRKRVAVARKRCYISNVAALEAFSTSEAEVDVRRAVDNLMGAVRADQIKPGGPTHKGELWKTIESFFDAIPFVGIERGEMGTLQFTQYIRCMSALRDAIRCAMYDNYTPDVDHRTLVPCFSALHLARDTIHTLEVAVQEAEKAVVDSVTATKTDVIMAFKKLKPREREDLRIYLEQREDFKTRADPNITAYRTYDQNKRKGIPRSMMGGNATGAAARWLVGGGGILNKLKTSKLETKMQSQHIELRQAQTELRIAQQTIIELQANGESQGKHKLMDELCNVLGIDDVHSVHADDIVSRVQRMRRRNIEGALNLFEQQGSSPLYKQNMKKLVELLDITTFESGSVEEEIVSAVEKLTRQVKMMDLERPEDDGNTTKSRDGKSSQIVRKFKLKSIGNMIKQMNAADKTHQHQRVIAARKLALKQRKGAQKASKKEVKRFIQGKGSVSNDVSLCSLLSGLNVVGNKQVPSGINVNNTLTAIYEAKVLADRRADTTGKQRMSLAQYLRTFLVHQYGVKKLAMKHMIGIIKTIKKHRKTVPRLNLFARLVGLDENDEKEYSSLAADYFLVVLVELHRAVTVKQLNEKNELDVASMMRDGITNKRLLSNNEISTALQNVDMGRGDRQNIMKRIQNIKSWDVDNFLIQVMDCWYESHNQRLLRTEQVFFDSDENGDGELTLEEFKTAVRVMEPHCPELDVVDLYDRIAGDDGVIDAEEFAQGVMMLHGHMIQHQRRIRETRRAAQIKESSAKVLTKVSKKNAAANVKSRVDDHMDERTMEQTRAHYHDYVKERGLNSSGDDAAAEGGRRGVEGEGGASAGMQPHPPAKGKPVNRTGAGTAANRGLAMGVFSSKF